MAGTSRMAFGPAQTTAIAVRPSSSRSDEMSNDARTPAPDASSAPRCTPPMPPVAKTRIPAANGGDHRGRHRRGRPPAFGEGDSQAGARGLPNGPGRGCCQRLKGPGVEPDQQPPVADRDRGRHGARRLADGGLGGRGHLEILRIGQSVADQRRLERDDGPALGESPGDLRRDDQSVGDRGRDGHTGRVAARLVCRAWLHAGP